MIARWLLLAALSSSVAATAGYWRGHHNGVRDTQLRTSDQALRDMSSLMENHRQLIQEANAAGLRLIKQTARRAALDNQTTQELRNALAKTADSRVRCVFNLDVMQSLAAARDRAAQAAATGLDESLPSAGTTSRQ
ncbi:hypothetical protein MO867_13540 [Microbulbifer sp. OS29]|uniref:Uncharacterized protein n=1 Tax=Microbulbifer okhotskensis TaxID=2926617 RepID=A0A9X2J8B1_9GAMM|nr:hypothetical protein [Microbulbifer okhotskensis]MCO1335356.1 hypothetical protein [Microbulbifer okhotskensis]